MAPSSKNDLKPRKSIKLTPGQVVTMNKALDDIQAHYGDVLASWDRLTDQRRMELRMHSPVLDRLLNLLPR